MSFVQRFHCISSVPVVSEVEVTVDEVVVEGNGSTNGLETAVTETNTTYLLPLGLMRLYDDRKFYQATCIEHYTQ